MLIAAVFYPLDVVKTRLQNQRTPLYKNEFDCIRKVGPCDHLWIYFANIQHDHLRAQLVKNEGFRSIYRGLVPQMIGVTLIQATKLTVNDSVRDRLTSAKTGEIELPCETLAGFLSGLSQVPFKNPLDMVKVRMQTTGSVRAFEVMRELGLRRLYTATWACIWRDSIYSAIFFPTYTRLKRTFGDSLE